MQNRYTGDIGDYGKLGLLRSFRGLSIGVNWYLVPDERHNEDGMFISYLHKPGCGLPDSELYDALRQIVEAGDRRVGALEEAGLLQAAYYSDILDFTGLNRAERAARRGEWHRQALNRLNGCSIVFLDPDNGLMVPSAEGTRRAGKYVEPDEIADYYRQGSSVIYYQHKARYADGHYMRKHAQILALCPGSTGLGLKFTKTSIRYYFFVLRPEHAAAVEASVAGMTPWRDYFHRLLF